MNWLTFGIALWVGLGLELGFRNALRIGEGSVAPSFLVPLLVWVSLSAPPRTVVWAALLIGSVIDLSWLIQTPDVGSVTLVGPHALGLALGAWVALSTRRRLMPKHPVTMAVLSAAAMAVAQAVVVVMITARSAYDPVAEWRPWSELGARLLSAVVTGGLGFLLAFPLRRTERLWEFAGDRGRRRF